MAGERLPATKGTQPSCALLVVVCCCAIGWATGCGRVKDAPAEGGIQPAIDAAIEGTGTQKGTGGTHGGADGPGGQVDRPEADADSHDAGVDSPDAGNSGGGGGGRGGGTGGTGGRGGSGGGGQGGQVAVPVWSADFTGCASWTWCTGRAVSGLECPPEPPRPPGTGALPAPPVVFASPAADLAAVGFGATLPGSVKDVTLSLNGVPFGSLRSLGDPRGVYAADVPQGTPAFESGALIVVTGAETVPVFTGDLEIPSPLAFTKIPPGLALTVDAMPEPPGPPATTGTTPGQLTWKVDGREGYVELDLFTNFMPDMHGMSTHTFCRVAASSGELTFELGPQLWTTWTATISRVTARPASPASAGVTLFARRPLATLRRSAF